MPNYSPEVDAFIERAADFAQPILKRLRKVSHRGCPEVVEVLKWGMPFFEFQGILAGMAAFKRNVSFGFWKGKLIGDPRGLFGGRAPTPMSARYMDLSELPPDKALVEYVKRAVALNASGTKIARPKSARHDPSEVEVPDYFKAALKKNKKAQAAFDAFGYSHRKEYVQWVEQAKQEETRQRRLGLAIKQLAQGKPRHWKYLKKPRKVTSSKPSPPPA
jgi:hypothetical protein